MPPGITRYAAVWLFTLSSTDFLSAPRPEADIGSVSGAPEVLVGSHGAAEPRRFRVSASRLAIPLPPYDIRVRRELAHRRTFVAIGRHLLRIVSLHVLDIGAAILAALGALQIVPVPDGRAIIPLMVGLVIVGLEWRG